VRRRLRYLYRNRRACGKPVKEYVAADGPAGELLARPHDTKRAAAQRACDGARERAAELLALGTSADAPVRGAAGGLLAAVGFNRHERGVARAARTQTTTRPDRTHAGAHRAGARGARAAAPLVRYEAPANDAEAVARFAAARAGEVGARERVAELVKARG